MAQFCAKVLLLLLTPLLMVLLSLGQVDEGVDHVVVAENTGGPTTAAGSLAGDDIVGSLGISSHVLEKAPWWC